VWILAPVIWLSFAGYGYWIAAIKRRQPTEGMLIGLFLGPIGCVVEACLRERTVEEVEERRVRLQEEAQAKLEEQQEQYGARQAERARRRQEAQKRAEAARTRRAEAYERFSAWFDQAILKFGWYKTLPEVAQPMVIGLLISVPFVLVLILMFKAWLRSTRD
jgi:hypothetical protein